MAIFTASGSAFDSADYSTTGCVQAVSLPRPAFLPPPPPIAQQAAYPAYAYQPPAQSYPPQQVRPSFLH